MDDKLEEDKQGLIELIEWYRDEYHKSDFCHTEMIEKIKQIQNEKELSIYEQVQHLLPSLENTNIAGCTKQVSMNLLPM